MTSIQDFLSLATMLVSLGLIAAGIMKLFQIAGDVQEVKEVLQDMRRISQGLGSSLAAPVPVPTSGVAALREVLPSGVPPALVNTNPDTAITPPGAPIGFRGTPPTPEELVRAVHAQNFSGDEFPL